MELSDHERVRLELDGTLCDGHGICLLCCPSRIELDEWGFAKVNKEAIDDPGELARARRAVAACPEGALRLVKVGRLHARAAKVPDHSAEKAPVRPSAGHRALG